MQTHPPGCDRAPLLAADYARDELDPGEKRAFKDHLASCPECRARVTFERRLSQELRSLRKEAVPPHLTRRVRGLLRRTC